MAMKQSDRDYIKDIITTEEFDYGMRYYSSFDTIEDEKFQKLLAAYKESADELEDYLRDLGIMERY